MECQASSEDKSSSPVIHDHTIYPNVIVEPIDRLQPALEVDAYVALRELSSEEVTTGSSQIEMYATGHVTTSGSLLGMGEESSQALISHWESDVIEGDQCDDAGSMSQLVVLKAEPMDDELVPQIVAAETEVVTSIAGMKEHDSGVPLQNQSAHDFQNFNATVSPDDLNILHKRRERERLKRRELRKNPEFREKEREKCRLRMQRRRQDPDYREEERTRDRQNRGFARQTKPELRNREREKDRERKRRLKKVKMNSISNSLIIGEMTTHQEL
ncbi:hypothetical protein CAPTEDRAFT_218946 [Capitella teleta]|uniref:Uncharacterized protein n=1 Tax=Capitella teleta TaxID=283909 RepID=R7V2A1_CAPTE|nr:hypothetical protein CAPTEDRAFT_218946 [Capitella teleta]|eukprot:ELU12654.1 hypothetical protein CAPTEDRAFT_218946 [Capitella teleta]